MSVTDALADLALVARRSTRLATWTWIILAASSLADFLWNLGPPFPSRPVVVLLTVAVEFVVYVVSYNSYRHDGDAHLRRAVGRSAILMVLLAIAYFAVAGTLVVHSGDTWAGDARGLWPTELAKQYQREHPKEPLWQVLEHNGGDVKSLYTPWTVDLARTALLGLWIGLYSAIAQGLATDTVGEARRKKVLPV